MKRIETQEEAELYFSLALRHAIVSKGIMQTDIAKAIGVSQQTVSKMIMRGGGSEKNRRAIANYFGFDYHTFLLLGQHVHEIDQAIDKGKLPENGSGA